MASVHVHVGSKKPRVGPLKRTAHWADRAVLGMVMGIAAFVIERAVIRGTKQKAEPATDGGGAR
jgi:hypothetical protein